MEISITEILKITPFVKEGHDSDEVPEVIPWFKKSADAKKSMVVMVLRMLCNSPDFYTRNKAVLRDIGTTNVRAAKLNKKRSWTSESVLAFWILAAAYQPMISSNNGRLRRLFDKAYNTGVHPFEYTAGKVTSVLDNEFEPALNRLKEQKEISDVKQLAQYRSLPTGTLQWNQFFTWMDEIPIADDFDKYLNVFGKMIEGLRKVNIDTVHGYLMSAIDPHINAEVAEDVKNDVIKTLSTKIEALQCQKDKISAMDTHALTDREYNRMIKVAINLK
ncbi:hypothetical protein JK167_13355 [Levilactobacillus brevis]|uniref:Uncharacterized protein n=1 Tax=Levilactobacillus brevis TaxID=1580 RepID=A0AA41ES02_LEVBR|nr:hypothetical protein [Levilactobacillus brevis]MBS0948599.1 hypothetical protein [Levilactobacillus brevis]MBS0979065.1 hypothetical protein [Levilactobacillus brevis]MBS1011793.1 hypothetical protein [Levilactobacillus brevis]